MKEIFFSGKHKSGQSRRAKLADYINIPYGDQIAVMGTLYKYIGIVIDFGQWLL